MTRRGNNRILFGAVYAALLLSIGQNSTQGQDTQSWNVAGPDDWNADENWNNAANVNFSGVPDRDFGDIAEIANNGTAEINGEVPAVAGLVLSRGTLDIQQDGSLKVDEDDDGGGGDATIGNSGVLRISGNGALEAGSLISSGSIHLTGTAASLTTRDDFTNSGDLAFDISGAGNAKINVGGAASLGGTIQPTFDGVSPAFGDSYEFLTGANSVTDNGAQIVLPESVQLVRGLGPKLATTNSTASISIGNFPILTVNRVNGAASLSNIVGDTLDITGYSILSKNGLLKSDGFTGIGGDWQQAPPRPEGLAELNLTGQTSLAVGDSINLGTPYNGGGTHPDDEDVRFEVSLADGVVVQGLVEYEGPANNLTLRIDPDTGEAEISNQSSFIDPFDLTGYSILSESGALKVDSWISLGGDWIIANPTANALAEINPSSSTTFGNGTEHALGPIFDTAGLKDLKFEFTTIDSVLQGTVEYGKLGDVVVGDPLDCNGDGVVTIADFSCSNAAGNTDQVIAQLGLLRGDFDGIGGVGFPDFLILSTNFGQSLGQYNQGDITNDGSVGFPDFLVLSTNFGQGAGAVAAAVPEPSNAVLSCFAGLLLLVRRRQR